MIKCLYCERSEFESGKGSNEHAILSSLGGKKTSRNICCVSCNKRLGDEIDKGLANEFVFISNFLNITTGRKKKAKTIKNAGSIDGFDFELKSGGSPYISKVTGNTLPADGNAIKMSFQARNPEEALKLMEQFALSNGKSLDDVVDTSVKVTTTYDIPKVMGSFRLGGEPFFRSVCKMMVTYLATLCDSERLRDGSFEKVIDYITGKATQRVEVSFDYNTNFPELKWGSEFYHQIFIWADPKEKLVFCGLKLFNHINLSCVLSRSWEGGEIKRYHAVDPISSQSVDCDADFGCKTINDLVEERGYDEKQFEQVLGRLITSVINQQQIKARENNFNEAIKYALASTGTQDLTTENLDKFINTVLQYLEAQMFNGAFEQTLTLEQLKQLK
ncbi:HNH endonuclease [Pseudoalteromonas sp. MMG022]|uniref:HNH endonuclease n=1 Tax=Pseudoalteromonas sp. MMG022 TaxID=2909978 RepID=UPI0031BB6479|nr:HNH endonuclease [Pseudoalteromonas sp. MMG022]